jgi:4-carboxymuconolactone decarboxylase
MASSHDARASHGDKLFGDQGLATTDPEFVEYFGTFAFGEVPAHGQLDERTRRLVVLAALIGCQAHGQYPVALDAALDKGTTATEAKELVYQAVAYLGIGRVYDVLNATNAVLVGRGVQLPLPAQSTTTPGNQFEKGWEAQAAIVGADRLASMHADAPADELHIQRWITANCFGGHYTRTGIDLRTRELLTFVLLVAQGGCDPQVRGHVAGNLNMGNGRQVLIDTLSQLAPYIGYPRTLNGLRAVDDVAPLPPADRPL